ncbi:hypothetical protein PRIPAC_75535 [Pristionchus pacificus]|uniref:Uncharacterized protein n=1 Tax=Pristionchus pacificus TaxID=54126 RepID=A0A2A6BZS0_PRIPA|nr:hypothetical protein PRIPAC_75535 [Pristionchus pacificus]|eukprot:PDM71273.1 hypothetical protein PRIPAC_37680 [Pristionchus pacificus]
MCDICMEAAYFGDSAYCETYHSQSVALENHNREEKEIFSISHSIHRIEHSRVNSCSQDKEGEEALGKHLEGGRTGMKSASSTAAILNRKLSAMPRKKENYEGGRKVYNNKKIESLGK